MSLSLGTILSKIENTEDAFDENKPKGHGRKPNDESQNVFNVSDSRSELIEEQSGVPAPKSIWGTRHTLGFMGLLGAACVYAMRVNLSVAIVAMVKTEPKNNTNNSDLILVCPPEGSEDDPIDEGNVDGDFEWDEATQGMILGVFFYGYLVTNLLGGRAAEIFGGKLVFGWGVVLTAVFTVLSPICAYVSTGLFIAVRVMEGLTEGVIFPAMSCMLAQWIPPQERSRFSTLVFSGAQFGTVITMPVSGWLCDTDFLGGWPSVFYVFGGLGIIWGIAWYFLVFSQPELHPRISDEEKAYILGNVTAEKKAVPVPWMAIFTSVHFWAILVAHVGYNWGFYTLLTELPTYLKNIQHFNMTSNGIFSALPYLVMWIFSMIYSNIMVPLQTSGKLSIIAVRRLSMAIGMYGPMIGLIAMCFVDCDQTLAMVVLCIAVGLCGTIYCGYMCSHQDLAPNLAGTLMGFTNAAATIPGFTAPYITGLIINDNQTLEAWRLVFIISSVVYFITGTFYIVFISGDVQTWNFPENNEAKDKSKNRRF